MNEKTFRSLEFNKICDTLATFASSLPAREAIASLQPTSDLREVRRLLDEVEEADKVLYQYSVNLSFAFDHIGAILEKADVMSVLTMGELLKVGRMLRVGRNLKVNLAKVPDPSIVLLKEISGGIYTDKALEDDIDRAILSDTEMSDNASVELRAIRGRIKRTGEAIKSKLYQYITSPSYAKFLQDNIVTIRGDRYVIPVKAEYRSAIPGLIHDQSASGQTVYIEPMAVVELNNTLKTHLLDEEREIERILREFTVRVSVAVAPISDSFEKIRRLDVIFAKTQYAHHLKAVKPVVNERGEIRIAKGRHPLIAPEKVVAVDVELGRTFDLLFITGPNTGGKTVSLKLVGLFSVMAMCGMYVPAADAELSTFEQIFTDIGDEQSIEQNLSTFSSHIANIVTIIDALNGKTLVLLDELGAGTDPTEGASLAVSISDFIRSSGAKAVITTHYNELKEYAVVTPRAENASMDFDPVTYSPTYRLVIGTPGASNAILIARKLGLKEEIVNRAAEGIREGKLEFENVLGALELARRNAVANEERTAELLKEAEETSQNVKKERDRLFLQREKLNENVKRETKRLVSEAMSEANEIIETLRSLLDDPTEQNLFEARRLRKSLTKYVVNEDNEFQGFGEEEKGAIEVGDSVLVKSLKVEGTVIAIDTRKGSATVKLGRMNSNFKLDVLQKLRKQKQEDEVPEIKSKPRALRNEAFSPEINLIGQTVAEADTALQAYLDKAVLAGVSEIRIIHGYGTGKLREAVRNFLKRHYAVKEYRDGIYGEGERGVTIAKLK